MLASLVGDPQLPAERHPRYVEAKAAYDAASVDLARTAVKAPAAGVVSNMKLQAGEYVEKGAPIFSLIESGPLWVEANFKETQLTDMRAGSRRSVVADAYPDVEWRARVAAIAPATGAEFAVLPPQNATGNWVKVVQRVPVRIQVEQPAGQPPLRAGMTVTVTRRHRPRARPAALRCSGSSTRASCRASWSRLPRSPAARNDDLAHDVQPRRPRHPALITASVMLGSLLYSMDWTIGVGGAAAHAGHVLGDAGPDLLGHHLLHRRLRHHDPDRRMAEHPLRAQARVRLGAGRVSWSPRCCAARPIRSPAEVLARIVQGMSGAFLIPLSQAIMLDTYPPEEHGKAMALWGTGSVCGSVIGPTMGGYVTEYLSWRWIFYINVPFGLIALLGLLAFCPRRSAIRGAGSTGSAS